MLLNRKNCINVKKEQTIPTNNLIHDQNIFKVCKSKKINSNVFLKKNAKRSTIIAK